MAKQVTESSLLNFIAIYQTKIKKILTVSWYINKCTKKKCKSCKET